jgi:2',3'-cyclic-nucleotide 2'-phosphodiesterase (5'-nucleotidase family)
LNEIAIIHTNDLHNRIGPVQVGKRNGYGGLKNIEAHLEKSASSHLLVDAGDFLDETAGFSQHRQMITYMNRTRL